ncbi:MAG: hypothetical protein ACOCXA_00280 [Planctomycetota bacterium]
MSRSHKRPCMRPLGPRSGKRWKRWEARRRRRYVHALVASEAPETIEEQLQDTRKQRYVRGDAIEIRWRAVDHASLIAHLRWLATQGVAERVLRRQYTAMTRK